MRIIAGSKKGFRLFSLPGEKTRPTKDSVKEAIFSMIYECDGLRVLDLYSGCGSLGLEALSRGASSLDLVDFSEKAIRTIKRNIEKLEFYESAKTYRSKVESFLIANEMKYDLILADPPYNKKMVNKTIKLVLEHNTLSENGLLVIEHFFKEHIKDIWLEYLDKQKKYGNTLVSFITPNIQ